MGSEERDTEEEGRTKLEALISRASATLARRAGLWSVLLFLLGLIWVCLFPLVCITTGELKCRGTYFSENALSAGNGRIAYGEAHAALAKRVDSLLLKQVQSDGNDSTIGLATIEQQLATIGLVDTAVLGERMVYGVVRPKSAADRREAIVLAAKLDRRSIQSRCCSEVAVALAVLSAMVQADWLSKNVVFIGVQSAEDLQEWMEGYLGLRATPRDLTQAGSLIGGLMLDFERDKYSASREDRIASIKVLAPGVNGQLPNLDLVNVLTYLLRPQRIEVQLTADEPVQYSIQALLPESLWQSLDIYAKRNVDIWFKRMQRLCQFMRGVAFGPSGWHAHLIKHDIHSVTLGMRIADEGEPGIDPELAANIIARLTEQTFRSLSNLEERFHQSYFLYLLPDTNLFVSIGEYSGSLLLLLSPLLLVFLAQATGDHKTSKKTKKNKAQPHAATFDPLLQSVLAILLNCISLASGAVLFSTGDQWLFAAGPIALVVLLTQWWIVRVCTTAAWQVDLVWRTARALNAVVVLIAHGMIGMVNYPFALFSAFWLVPVLSLARPRMWMPWRLLLGLWSVALPVAFLWSLPRLVPNSSLWPPYLSEFPNGTAKSLVDMFHSYGLFHWPILVLVVYPSLLTSTAVLFLSS